VECTNLLSSGQIGDDRTAADRIVAPVDGRDKVVVALFGTPLVNVAISRLVNGTSAGAVKLVGTAEITVSPKAKV